jgi:hypothetical protein
MPVEVKKPKDKRDIVMSLLKENERNIMWLSKKLNLSYSHLYFILKRREREFTSETLKSISELFGVNI